MKTMQLTVWLILLCAAPLASISHGQSFSSPSRYASNWTGSNQGTSAFANYDRRLVNSAYTAPTDFANRNSSYWVERDPRYLPALPQKRLSPYVSPVASSPVTSYRPPYSAACAHGGCATPSYGSGYGAPVYRGQGPSNYAPSLSGGHRGYGGGYGGYSVPPARSPDLRYQVPQGYYRGDGLFGKDTVFAKNQPVRNFFRYIMP